MRKKLLRPIALSLLWLCFGLSCKKEEVAASCDPSECCGSFKYTLKQTLEGIPVDLLGTRSLVFEKPFEGRPSLPACINQWKMLEPYERTTYLDDPKPPLKYKVWGKIYHNMEVWNIGKPYELYEVYIERIEKVN